MADPPGAESVALVPAWLDRLAAVGWRLLAVIGFAFVVGTSITAVPTVTAATLVGLLVAAALAPTVIGLRRRGMGRTAASGLATILGIVVAVAILAALAVALVPYVADLVTAVRDGVDDLRDELVGIGAPELALAAFDRLVVLVRSVLSIDLVGLAGPAVVVGTVVVLGTFLTFFLLTDGDRGWAWAMRSLEPWKAEALTVSARHGLARVSGFLRRIVLLAVVDATVVWLAAVLLGVGLSGPLAVVAFVAGFVPYLGAIVAATVATLVALAAGGPGAAVAMLAAIVATSVVAGRLLASTARGAGVDVHPILVLVAIPAAAILFGLIGVLAILPLTVFALALSRAIVTALDLAPGAARPVAAGGVPVWLDRLAQWSWRGLVAIALVWVVIQVIVAVPGVVLPVVLAIVLAATIAPLARMLRRRGWNTRLAAAAATVGAALAAVAALVVTVLWSVGPVREIAATAIDGAELTGLAWLEAIGDGVATAIVAGAAGVLRGLLGLVVTVVLALLLTYYLLSDGTRLWRSTLRMLDGEPRRRLNAQGTRALGILGGYMVGTAIISAFGAVTSALIMVLLGLPLALPIGVLTFIAGFIPLVGSAVTTGLAVLIAVAVGTTFDIVVMMAWTIVFNLVQGNFVTPLVYGRTFSLHPAIILLAIPAGSDIAGILGMFLVVPVVAIIAATWRPLLDALGGGAPARSATPTAATSPAVGGVP